MENSKNYCYGIGTPGEEAYRVLRTNIQFCGSDKKIKTLVVTSCKPGEGKTTVAVNLAIYMAKAGRKVLLVDADMRKPTITLNLESKESAGLSSLISGFASLTDIIKESGVENLYIISCGPKPPNPAELLGTSTFEEFLGIVADGFDMVIIDTPPLGRVIDSAIIASKTDASLFVVEAGGVDCRSAQRVKKQLEESNTRIIGAVINKVKGRESGSYYGYYTYGSLDEKKEGALACLNGLINVLKRVRRNRKS